MSAMPYQLSFDLNENARPLVLHKRSKSQNRTETADHQLAFMLYSPPDSRIARARRGALSYASGLAAETQVAKRYARRGASQLAERWRGKGGELDLVFQEKEVIVFVEVKRGRTHESAVERLTPRQVSRLYTVAEEYVGAHEDATYRDVRFDVATVNAAGEISIRQNAFA